VVALTLGSHIGLPLHVKTDALILTLDSHIGLPLHWAK